MNFYLFSLIQSLILYSLVSTTFTASFQQSQSLHPSTTTLPTDRKLSSSNDPSQFYRDGCTAILMGCEDINPNTPTYEYSFSTWENQNPSLPLLGFFDHSKGKITKLWKKDTTTPRWGFYLRIYDGNYIDHKFAEVLIDLDSTLQLSSSQSDGTFKTKDSITLKFVYGTNNKVESTKDINGQLSLNFINKDTKNPVTSFDENNKKIKSESVQITFVSSDNTLSFKTTLFSPMNSIVSSLDKAIVYLFAAVYILISLTSRYSSYLGRKVSLTSMQAAFFSSSFILCWIWDSHYFHGDLYYILMIAAVVDWGKHLYFFLANMKNWKASRSAIYGVALSVFAGGLHYIPSIWMSLLPSIVYLVPLVQKIKKGKYGFQEYLTRFEISNWTCMSLWMSYVYLYPRNIYFFEPRPLIVALFVGLLEIQFFILMFLQITQRASDKPLLQNEESKCELSLGELNLDETSDYERVQQRDKKYSLDCCGRGALMG